MSTPIGGRGCRSAGIRAVQERDSEAWAAIATQYRRLLIAWAAQCQASRMASESYEDLADRALARAWAALTPERFSGFPGLPALLILLVRGRGILPGGDGRRRVAQQLPLLLRR